jgi:glycosidase
MMKKIMKMSRDHARTPMQWSSEENAGFTNGKPWLKVNPNYQTINVKQDETNEKSIQSFYKAILLLRKNHKALIMGDYQEYDEKNPHIFFYTRSHEGETFTIVGNLTSKPRKCPKVPLIENLILSNVKEHKQILDPYEIRVYHKEK